MRRSVAAAVAALLAGSVMFAAPASAHTVDGTGPTNFITEISDVSPAVAGVELRVLEFGSQLELTNRSDDDVVVVGYEGEPYLRIGPEGVFENRRSPATYINADRQGQTPVPTRADPAARPEWNQISDGHTASWHDHRIHWMGSRTPPAVEQDSSREHVIYPNWEVPLRVGGQDVIVSGTLRWVPGPSPWPWLAGAALVAAAVVLLAWRWWAPVLAALAVVLVVGDVLHAVGLAWAPRTTGSAVARFAAGSFIPLVGWAAGLVGARLLLRRDPFGAYLVAAAALFVVLIGGVGDLPALSRPHVAFTWGEIAARSAVAGSIGIGIGVIVGALLAVRRATGSFLGSLPVAGK